VFLNDINMFLWMQMSIVIFTLHSLIRTTHKEIKR
jgi:hypothetical protein